LSPVDLRDGFDGLAAKAQQVIGADPFSGHLFIFRGERSDYFKGLCWDGSGMWLIAKRLEKGRFVWPPIVDGSMMLTPAQFLGADRGDGLATNNSTTAARPANADLTHHRFLIDSGSAR
jgi:transposase